MKLGRILRESIDGPVARLVAVDPGRELVVDLAAAEHARLLGEGATPEAARRVAAAHFPGSMAAAIAAGSELLPRAERAMTAAGESGPSVLALGDVRWLPAVDPPVARDCMAFEEHAVTAYRKGMGSVPDAYYEIPAYYKASQAGFLGHDQEVPWPAYTESMDYELELGFVIGRAGRDLDAAAAAAALFGVTIYSDFSARDQQSREMTLTLGPTKGKDFGTGVGPWITTVDELDLDDLEMVARINGAEWSRGNAGSIMWSAAELLAYVSTAETLQPGDLIGSGTVGRGCGLELDRRLSPGDVVELEVEGIGVMRNRMGQPEPPGWTAERKAAVYGPPA
jgi:2-keto-4-pentenoate hydratase/2-oxohepta-3-ene-1,7-dioic acid hydratase in catechol pathway